MLGNSVAVAVVVRTRPRAMPLAMITKRTHGFPFLSHMSMGLRLVALPWPFGPPELRIIEFRYLSPAVKKKHIALKFSRKGIMLYNFTKKQKYHVANVSVKSKIVTFLLVNV